MATLVLTAIGSAIGGPIGGAIGSIIGQQVDSAIFVPKARQGARLKELAVQTSSYGSQVPAIFGAMRVAGTVIWATDLIERRAKSGGGKGRPSSINYSYSVSMAVALSSRPIDRIGRIWADGNVLRGIGGDLKVDTQLRIYTGHDDQPLDPLMASAEQSGQCPAYRGIAYALFEDLQLADYGNRIPSLTFEIFERDGPVPVNAIFGAALGADLQGTSLQSVQGFAASGASAQEPLGALLDVLPIELRACEATLQVRDPSISADSAAIAPICEENRKKYDLPSRSLDSAAGLPHLVTLRYYDSDRDYQASLQRSERGAVSHNMFQIELPAVLSAVQAKQIVEHRHHRFCIDRDSWQGEIASGPDPLLPGDVFADRSGKAWRVEQAEYRLGSVGISARSAVANVPSAAAAAIPGRNLPSPDLTVGETHLAVIEMPAFGTDDPGTPLLAAFAAGTGAGWRRAALSLQVGEALIDIGTTASPAAMGRSIDPLSPHNPLLIDDRAGFRVQLSNSAIDIAERTGSPLDADAPYIWLDGEFIRYGHCEALGGGIFRFSSLQRGCFRSDFTIPNHGIGERFVLFDPDSALLINHRIFALGEAVHLEAIGLGDPAPVSASALINGLAIAPFTPVHGEMIVLADGSVEFRWSRRSRIDSGWRDGVDQVLAEQQEQYLVSLYVDGLPVADRTSFESRIAFSPTQWAEFSVAANARITAEIRQVGRHAQSQPLIIIGS